jgi:hypothetical protein
VRRITPPTSACLFWVGGGELTFASSRIVLWLGTIGEVEPGGAWIPPIGVCVLRGTCARGWGM